MLAKRLKGKMIKGPKRNRDYRNGKKIMDPTTSRKFNYSTKAGHNRRVNNVIDEVMTSLPHHLTLTFKKLVGKRMQQTSWNSSWYKRKNENDKERVCSFYTKLVWRSDNYSGFDCLSFRLTVYVIIR